MMHIKAATLDNVADIVKIENTCFSTPWTEQGIAESIENKNTILYIATIDGKVAGYMGLQIFSGEGYVTNVATLPEYRNKGVASSLLKKAMENDMEFITLEVRESNTPAINLYTEMGFKNMGTRPKFYTNPNENAIIMTKYLK